MTIEYLQRFVPSTQRKARERQTPGPFCISSPIGAARYVMKSISICEGKIKRRRERDAARNVLPGNIVYILGKSGVDSFKVGRTSNYSARMDQYRSYLGPDVVALVQIEVPTKRDAALLEAEFVSALDWAEARRGREWFKMPYPALATLLSDVLSSTAVNVDRVRGAPCCVDRGKTLHASEVKAVRSRTFSASPKDGPFR